MSTKQNETQVPSVTVVYIVTCYQSIVGVYANQTDASQVQRDLIFKNRPADILCRSIIFSSKSE